MDSLEKVVYEAPAIQVVELSAENCICTGSPDPEAHAYGYDGWY